MGDHINHYYMTSREGGRDTMLPQIRQNSLRSPGDLQCEVEVRTPSQKLATRKKYTYAAFFLSLSLISFVIQTETAVYIQHQLGWNKAYCMLYFTHGSWALLWPTQLLILRLQKWKMPWKTFWRRHIYLIRTTAQMVEAGELDIPRGQRSPISYILKMTAFVTCALTVAGGSCVPLLKEPLRWDKSFAVMVAIIGVLVVAYGDSTPTKHGGKSGGSVGGKPGDEKDEASNRVLGNLVIGVVLANATFSGSFLILISLTSPVLSSVAALLTIFLVAIVDWAITGVPLSPAAVTGGLLIIVAFLLLSYSTYREMQDERRKKEIDLSDHDSDSDKFDD
ncbi:hypothetical protein DID88_010135 [Monilinia fructigena]|uniref:EamA domain-containing protein n=1 Tax=Monilinia fructigena TaxID=38457 RepID=A0A395IRQ3_9HELO|nr:hypothetical protein DID88_010135 [Monilinia fructigena]